MRGDNRPRQRGLQSIGLVGLVLWVADEWGPECGAELTALAALVTGSWVFVGVRLSEQLCWQCSDELGGSNVAMHGGRQQMPEVVHVHSECRNLERLRYDSMPHAIKLAERL